VLLLAGFESAIRVVLEFIADGEVGEIRLGEEQNERWILEELRTWRGIER